MENNTVLITGGSNGIGFEFAKQLLSLGNRVIVTGRDPEKLERVRSELPQIHVIRSDVNRMDDMRSLYERVTKDFPELNVLINNAGIGRKLDLRKQQDITTLTEELSTNLLAPIQMINQFYPLLAKQPEAAIVNVTSALAFAPFPIVPVYCAAKSGLHSFTISLRAQLRETRIKVFEIAPPTTQTDLLREFAVNDLRGVTVMGVSKMVSESLQKMKVNQFEICPGQAGPYRFMSRVAPKMILKRMSTNRFLSGN